MRTRHYTVEATTPDGLVEMTGEATATAPFTGVVSEIVADYARETGLTEAQITVTSAWYTTEVGR